MNIELIKNNLIDKKYNLIYKESVTSTNTVLREMANSESEFTVLISDHQTNGMGRKGNTFFSPEKTGIYMSILLKPQLSLQDFLLITPLSAVCTARAIEKISQKEAKIKWVNDIYVDNKKVCGILAQSITDTENNITGCILGIGINVCAPSGGFPEDIKNKAGYLFNKDENKNLREMIIAEVLNNFSSLYKDLTKKLFYEEYVSRSLITNKTVNVIYPDREIKCLVLGIDKDFLLDVKLENGDNLKLDSGEVSLILE